MNRQPSTPSVDSTTAGGGAKNVAVTRKVNKLLDVAPTDSLLQLVRFVDQTCPQLSADDAAVDSNAVRKMLRPMLEGHVVDLHGAFLEEFRKVYTAYSEFNNALENLDAATRSVEVVVQAHKEQSLDLVSAVGDLRAELEEVHTKEKKLREFHERYSLTPDEQQVLKTGDVDPRFLAVLQKVSEIHSSCRTLLMNEHHQAAVDIMETMYLAHLQGVEKLTKFLAGAIADVLSHGEPDISSFFIACVAAVQQRPAQWAKVMQEIARVRKTGILRRFYDALTKGTPVMGMKPIDANSHDSVRFFGDVLAWLHQTIAEEDDLMSNFFASPQRHQQSRQVDQQQAPDGQQQQQLSSVPSLDVSKADLLDQIFEGLCKHIAQRFTEALAACRKVAAQSPSTTIVTLFKLEGVFSFYCATSANLLGPNSALVTTLQDCKLTVLRVFYDLLKTTSGKMATARPSKDLSTPPEAHEMLRTLRAMMESMENSLVPHSEREQVFQPILGAVVDPIPALVGSAADALDDASRLVWKLNILCHVQTALVGYGFTAAKLKKVTGMIEEGTRELHELLRTNLFGKFGFTERLLVAAAGNNSTSTGDADAAVESMIAAALQQFYAFAASAGLIQIPMVEYLQSVKLREHVSRSVTADLFDAYAKLYEHVLRIASSPDQYRHLDPRKARILLDAE